MSTIKRILIIAGIVLTLLVAAVISLPFIIDPNDFKEDFEQLAAKQGVDLNLGGDITWQFYPSVGLSVNDVSVAPLSAPDQKLADAKQLSAAVALMPLFKKQIRIEKLLADAANIQLIVDQNGKGNWEAITASNTEENPTASETENAALNLTIDSIELINASLKYDDQQTQELTSVENFNLSLSNVNLEQRAFPLSLSATVTNPALSSPLPLQLNGDLEINENISQFVLKNTQLKLDEAGADIEIELEAQVQLDSSLTYSGDLRFEVSNVDGLFALLAIEKPITADDSVLSRINATLGFEGNDTQFSAPSFTVNVDDTTLNGNASVTFPSEQKRLSAGVKLNGNQINIDRYLAPTTETETTSSSTNSAQTNSEDAPLPLESLRNLNASIVVDFKQLIANKLQASNLNLAVKGDRGLWQLSALTADFYQGKLKSSGQFDARKNTASMTFTANMTGLAVQPLLVDLAELDTIRGSIDIAVNATTQAATTQAIMNNLNATANFTGNQVVFNGFNVEQNYCQLVAQVNKENKTDEESTSATKTWAKETPINQVDGQIVFANQQLDLKKLQAEIAALRLAAKGKVNLNEEKYEVSLPLRLTQAKTSETGCQVSNEFFLDREINVVGCDGSLTPMDFAKQCGLRNGAVTDIAKQALRYNFEKKGGNEKVDEKKQEIREKAKDKLRDLLN